MSYRRALPRRPVLAGLSAGADADAPRRLFFPADDDDDAAFDDDDLAFYLRDSPIPAAGPGHYRLISKGRANIPGDFLYRMNHPLGEHTISQGKGHACPCAEVVFDISAHSAKVSVIEQLKGRSGWLTLQHLRIDSLEREAIILPW